MVILGMRAKDPDKKQQEPVTERRPGQLECR